MCLVLEFSAVWAGTLFVMIQIPIHFLLGEQGFPETVWEVTGVSGRAEAICVWALQPQLRKSKEAASTSGKKY